eukprot:204274-Rhodomonas_salina.2
MGACTGLLVSESCTAGSANTTTNVYHHSSISTVFASSSTYVIMCRKFVQLAESSAVRTRCQQYRHCTARAQMHDLLLRFDPNVPPPLKRARPRKGTNFLNIRRDVPICSTRTQSCCNAH